MISEVGVCLTEAIELPRVDHSIYAYIHMYIHRLT